KVGNTSLSTTTPNTLEGGGMLAPFRSRRKENRETAGSPLNLQVVFDPALDGGAALVGGIEADAHQGFALLHPGDSRGAGKRLRVRQRERELHNLTVLERGLGTHRHAAAGDFYTGGGILVALVFDLHVG